MKSTGALVESECTIEEDKQVMEQYASYTEDPKNFWTNVPKKMRDSRSKIIATIIVK